MRPNWDGRTASEVSPEGALPNVWLGVSAEDQKRADERIPVLLETPAATRFVSAEPLLGPIDLLQYLVWDESMMHWIIVGGESGHSARPMHPDWARSLREQCAAAGVPFFFKQFGEWHPSDQHDPDNHKVCDYTPLALNVDGRTESRPMEAFKLLGKEGRGNGWAGLCRIGKRAAGRLLDGREHNEMPERAR
jgi:protein gp37